MMQKRCDYCGGKKRGKCKKPECLYLDQRFRWLKRSRNCKACGELFVGGNGQTYCSAQCNPAKERIDYQATCVSCGVHYEKRLSKEQAAVSKTCSMECQRQWALVKNQHTPSIDWLKRSKKAKAKWKRMRSRERKRKWVVRRELMKIRKKRRAYEQRQTVEGQWRYRIRVRRNSSRGRMPRRNKQPIKPTSVKAERKRLKQKRHWYERCIWRKKVGNKLSNLTKRRKRKRNVEEGRSRRRSDLSEDCQPAVQMCFEWD